MYDHCVIQPPSHLLLIESDSAVASWLTSLLEGEGYAVAHAPDGVTGLNLARRSDADQIIIAADLAGIDGITLCGAIRSQIDTPIIVLMGDGDELQRVIALDRGADVVMSKPISAGELRARVRSLLRRSGRAAVAEIQAISVGELRVNIQMRRAWFGPRELQLTPKEFDLLAYLVQHRGLAIPRDQLLKAVWRDRVDPTSQTLDVHIRWLRQKVEPEPDQPIYIRTVRMIGYRLEGPLADKAAPPDRDRPVR